LAFSIGSALYDPAKPSNLDHLIALADEQMYVEKKKNNQSA
jgi:GGDEF domain-containing protein